MTKRPTIEFYDDKEVVVINGTKYSYSFFDELSVLRPNVGALLRVEDKTTDGNTVLSLVEQRWDEDRVVALVDQIDEGLVYDPAPDAPPPSVKWQKPILDQLREIRREARATVKKLNRPMTDRACSTLEYFDKTILEYVQSNAAKNYKGERLVEWWRGTLALLVDDLV